MPQSSLGEERRRAVLSLSRTDDGTSWPFCDLSSGTAVPTSALRKSNDPLFCHSLSNSWLTNSSPNQAVFRGQSYEQAISIVYPAVLRQGLGDHFAKRAARAEDLVGFPSWCVTCRRLAGQAARHASYSQQRHQRPRQGAGNRGRIRWGIVCSNIRSAGGIEPRRCAGSPRTAKRRRAGTLISNWRRTTTYSLIGSQPPRRQTVADRRAPSDVAGRLWLLSGPRRSTVNRAAVCN
jgi:hypothetical protein